MALLDEVKMALRITTDAYDSELTSLIDSAKRDLEIAGVYTADPNEAVKTAIKTYCKVNFGTPNPNTYEYLKKSYDEQKAQMSTSTSYASYYVESI